MAQVNPDIPVIGNPVATEDPKVKNALEAIVNALNAIDNANIASNADINGAKLLAGSINTTQIADAAITSAKIAPNAVSVLGTAAPTSSILQFAGTSAPSGWLFCDGTAVSRSTYADLFNAVGTAYGEGNGSTTFNLPDLRGRVPVGRDTGQTEFDTRGETGGSKTHTLTESEMPVHTHSVSGSTTSAGSHSHSGSALSAGGHSHSYDDGYVSLTTNSQRGTASPTASTVTSITNTDQTRTTVMGGAHTHTLSINSDGSHSHSINASAGSTGGGSAHNNLQPYVVVNYIIKV